MLGRGHRKQNATISKGVGERITVTMPLHPWCGRQLVLERIVRLGRPAVAYADVSDPDGLPCRLPLAWTDRGGPVVIPRSGDGCARIGPHALLRLADAVAGGLGGEARKLAEGARIAERKFSPAPDRRSPPCSAPRTPVVGGAVRANATEFARHLGGDAATARRDSRGGGDR